MPIISWKNTVRLRKGVQVLSFVCFIVLIWGAGIAIANEWIVDLFFRLNPLSMVAAMLSTRAWLPYLSLALVTVGATLLFGRIWCGWICPMGSLLEWVHFKRPKKHKITIPQTWRSVKYLLLISILSAALLGNLTLLTFDPLALISRMVIVVFIPALNLGITWFELALYRIPFFQPWIDWIESFFRGRILPLEQPNFAQNVWIAALFGLILCLNLLAERFWCRYLCPLGALLGWLSKLAVFRPVFSEACDGCTRCTFLCPTGAIQAKADKVDLHIEECTLCMDCLNGCEKSGICYRPSLRIAPLMQEYDPGRRQTLAALFAGVGGVLLLHSGLRQQNNHLIRPPGAQDEAAFLAACLRCSLCLRACPTNALQPALDEAGLEGFWTPVLIPRQGYCNYGCNLCGKVCPSGAIPPLPIEEKRMVVLGKASVLRDRCLPWASNTPCIVCEEMCPTPQKSIRLDEISTQNTRGEELVLQRPYVIRELCIGCGICENRCPLEGEAGIRIYGV